MTEGEEFVVSSKDVGVADDPVHVEDELVDAVSSILSYIRNSLR